MVFVPHRLRGANATRWDFVGGTFNPDIVGLSIGLRLVHVKESWNLTRRAVLGLEMKRTNVTRGNHVFR